MTCNRRPYATEAAANSVLFAIRARDSEAGERLEVAPCSGCNAFHVQRKDSTRPVVTPYNPTVPRGRPSLPYIDD